MQARLILDDPLLKASIGAVRSLYRSFRLLIRRSLVRAQVGEPRKSTSWARDTDGAARSNWTRYWRTSNIQYLAGLAGAGLIGCSQAEGPPAVAESTLQFFGDSTQVQAFEYLREHFPGATLRAVGGTRSDMLLDGTDGLNRPWPASVAAPVVVINHGMNDARPWAKVPLDAYRANLRRLAKAPALVVFETPNPSTYPGRDTAPYAQAMREVAAEVGAPLIDVHACFQTLPDWRAALYDQVHPNERGLRHIADVCVAPRLRAIMQRVT